MLRIFLSTLLVLFISGCQLSFGCSSNVDCFGLYEICSNDSCACKDGYVRDLNSTCVYESVKGRTTSYYSILVAIFAVLIGISLITVVIVIFMMRKKTYKLERTESGGKERYQMTTLKHKPSIRQILGEYNEPKYSHYDDSPEATKYDFERLVESLRPDAPIFLKMINEVKRKLNLLENKTTTQGMQYKALIRDLSRVLQMLNKNPAKLYMPLDGVGLLLWAENALKRFEHEELQNPIKDRETHGECSTAIHDAVL